MRKAAVVGLLVPILVLAVCFQLALDLVFQPAELFSAERGAPL